MSENKTSTPGCFTLTFFILALLYAIFGYWDLFRMLEPPSSWDEIIELLFNVGLFVFIITSFGAAIDYGIYILETKIFNKSEDDHKK